MYWSIRLSACASVTRGFAADRVLARADAKVRYARRRSSALAKRARSSGEYEGQYGSVAASASVEIPYSATSVVRSSMSLILLSALVPGPRTFVSLYTAQNRSKTGHAAQNSGRGRLHLAKCRLEMPR